MKILLEGKIHIVNNLVFNGFTLVIPCVLCPAMLNKIHRSHQGIFKSIYSSTNAIYWPSTSPDIQNKVGQISICNKFK